MKHRGFKHFNTSQSLNHYTLQPYNHIKRCLSNIFERLTSHLLNKFHCFQTIRALGRQGCFTDIHQIGPNCLVVIMFIVMVMFGCFYKSNISGITVHNSIEFRVHSNTNTLNSMTIDSVSVDVNSDKIFEFWAKFNYIYLLSLFSTNYYLHLDVRVSLVSCFKVISLHFAKHIPFSFTSPSYGTIDT